MGKSGKINRLALKRVLQGCLPESFVIYLRFAGHFIKNKNTSAERLLSRTRYNPAAQFRHTNVEPGRLLRAVYADCVFALEQSKRTPATITWAKENRVLLALPPLEIPHNLCRTAQSCRVLQSHGTCQPPQAWGCSGNKPSQEGKKTNPNPTKTSKAHLQFPVWAGEQSHDTKHSNAHSSIIPCGNVQITLAWQPSSRTSCPYTESYTHVFLFALL